MKLIVQIPCLNESLTLHHVLNDIPTEIPGIDSIETLVVDDGSTDGTAATALSLGVHHIARHRHNRGLAAAFSTGLATACALGADIIVNTDGDNQYPGRYITSLVQPLLADSADIVIGDRRPEQDSRQSLAKRGLYLIGRIAVSRVLGRKIPDPVSGFRAYSRNVAERMYVVTRFSYTIETLMQSIEKGHAIRFVPITTNSVTRPSRLFRSHIQFVTRSGATLLRVFYMYHPLQALVYLSGLIGMFGSLPIVRFVVFYSLGEGEGHLQSLILGATLMVLAAVTLLTGLLAELVSHNRVHLDRVIEDEIAKRHINAVSVDESQVKS
ncbi:MAG: glycosyltransferase family 2 protein [Aureliella sp.]